jgi:formyl-CoA transferase
MPQPQSEGALAGIRVVELGQLIAGPFCGQLLGDMGAEVIKVEPPGQGDPMRAWGRGEHKLWWEVVARNKKSVSANLRVPEGQEIVRKLVEHADILIENFKPGTIEKMGPGSRCAARTQPAADHRPRLRLWADRALFVACRLWRHRRGDGRLALYRR